VRLLDVDPELGRWLRPAELAEARLLCVVPTSVLPPGPWELPRWSPRDTHLGYMVLEGLLERDEDIAGTTATKLLGPGELVQPDPQLAEESLLSRQVHFRALESTRVGVLRPPCAQQLARWPALMSALIQRAMRSSSRAATQQAISQLPRVDERLLLLFWHLAERHGRVTPGGVRLPLRLHHLTLGHLVGAKRPTVTLALRDLLRDGRIEHGPDGSWILRGDPPGAMPAAVPAAPASALVLETNIAG
jgi:CRP-like cAMP-binding protein